jgi:hypothetical protein
MVQPAQPWNRHDCDSRPPPLLWLTLGWRLLIEAEMRAVVVVVCREERAPSSSVAAEEAERAHIERTRHRVTLLLVQMAETAAMPAHDRFGLHEDEHLGPARPALAQNSPESAVRHRDASAPIAVNQNRQLLAQGQVLQNEVGSTP